MVLNNKGITLIELLVLGAIVVVLVVVSGTQLMAYNYQSANAAAVADLRNAAAAEKVFWTNYGGAYASSSPVGASGPAMTVFTSVNNNTGPIGIGYINGTSPTSMTTFQIDISQNVGIAISTSAIGGSYVMVSKHAGGDRCFAMDSDAREMYMVNGGVGMPLTVASLPSAVSGPNDFAPGGYRVPGSGVCNGNPSGSGHFEWTAL